jgi:hypothetical protein
MSFDASRLSNAGKEAARAHKQMRKAGERLMEIVDQAIEEGFSVREIENVMLRFCSSREERMDALSLWLAVCQIREREEA